MGVEGNTGNSHGIENVVGEVWRGWGEEVGQEELLLCLQEYEMA